MPVSVHGHTDIGRKRTNNEDSYICLPFAKSSELKYLIAVADGMGGHRGGEIASGLAVTSIKTYITAKFSESVLPNSDFKAVLEGSIENANSEIFSQASQKEELTGMGSTVVAALLSDSEAVISNVGDSRAYLIRGKQIEQITTDHNWKSEQLQLGELKEDDIKSSPYKDLITRSLGLKEETEVDSYQVETAPGDYLLLCSDGLHSLLSEKEILKTFRKYKKPKTIAHKLIEAANKKGGHDNITVIIGFFFEREPGSGLKSPLTMCL